MNVVVAGDFCLNLRTSQMCEADYERAFLSVSQLVRDADYSLVNLESPIVTENLCPIKKSGPVLKSEASVVSSLSYLGFRCVTLANNHIADYSFENALATQSFLEQHHFDTVGVGVDRIDSERILLKTIDNKLLAVINCCESEFSVATKDRPGANPLNPIGQFYAIQKAKGIADYVLVIVHGGHEFYPYPSPRMKEIYRFFVDVGADAVVNHHQHCCSGYEVYRNKPIFYGIGNFFFDGSQRDSSWNIGMLLHLSFEKSKISFRWYPFSQCDEDPVVRMLTSEEVRMFDREMSEKSSVIADDDELKKRWVSFAETKLTMLQDAFSPYAKSWTISLVKHGFLPRFLQPARLKEALNMMRCESHRDVLSYLLEKYSEK